MTLDLRSIRRFVLPLLAILALSVGVVACGGSDDKTASKNDYINDVNNAQKKFADGAAKLNLANPSSPEDFKKSLDGLDPLLSGIVSDLQGIKPPDEVKSEHQKLISSMQDYQKQVDDAKSGLSSSDKEQVKTSAQTIATASQQFQTDFGGTVDSINQKLHQ
jgi:hypothetical protein